MAKPAEASNVGIAETKEFKDQAESKASEPDAGEYTMTKIKKLELEHRL